MSGLGTAEHRFVLAPGKLDRASIVSLSDRRRTYAAGIQPLMEQRGSSAAGSCFFCRTFLFVIYCFSARTGDRFLDIHTAYAAQRKSQE